MTAPVTDSMPRVPAKPYPGLIQAVVLMTILFVLQVGIGIAALILGTETSPGDPWLIAEGNLIAFGIMLLFVKWWSRKNWRELLPFSPFPVRIILPLIPLLLGLSVIVSEADNVLRFYMPMPAFVARMFQDIRSGGVSTFVTLVLVAPLTEELMFRGVILGGFLKRYSTMKAVVYGAILFALFHIIPYQYFGGLMAGILLGLLMVRTRSLYLCLLVHAMYNASSAYLGRVLPVDIPGFTGIPGEVPSGIFQPLWFDAVGMMLFVLGCVGLVKVRGIGKKTLEKMRDYLE